MAGIEEDGNLNRNDLLYSLKFIQSLKINTKCYRL